MFKIVIHDAQSSLRARLEARSVPPMMVMRGIINDTLLPNRLTIWAWDGKGGNDTRRKIFPGYKNRPPSPNDMTAALGMLRELLRHTTAFQAKADGFEGDDMVAALVENFRGKYPIEIITKDQDLTALCDASVTCSAKAPVIPSLIRLYKLTVGDKSDTIPGIKGFGPKDWEKCSPELLESVLLDPDFSDEQAALAGLRPPHVKWLRENFPQVTAMRQIIHPITIPPDVLDASIIQGVDNPVAREALLAEFMQ